MTEPFYHSPVEGVWCSFDEELPEAVPVMTSEKELLSEGDEGGESVCLLDESSDTPLTGKSRKI